MENWKPVVGYEELYEVSDLGSIRSIADRKNTWAGKVLKSRIRSNGYRQFGLTSNGKTRHYKAARIVAKAFLPNPKNKPTVNHKDGVKTNDALPNLEWATVSENTQHAYRNGLAKTRRGEESTSARLTEFGVMIIRQLLKSGTMGNKISRQFGISEMMVSDIRLGKTWNYSAQ